jgi:hypothetical protein
LGDNAVGHVFVEGSGGSAKVYAATSEGLSISTNGGSTFVNKTTSNGLGSNTVNGVYASGANIYVATGNGLAISTNGGSSFTNYTTANGLPTNFLRGVYVNAGVIYVATNNAGLSISTNGGATFVTRTSSTNGLGDNNVRRVYAVGNAVYVAHWGGGGLSFAVSSDPPLSSENLSLENNAPFTFPTSVIHGGTYSVVVQTQPDGLVCTLSNASGMNVTSNVTSITATCVISSIPDDAVAAVPDSTTMQLPGLRSAAAASAALPRCGSDCPPPSSVGSSESVGSSVADTSTGSVYQIVRNSTLPPDAQQDWTLEYLSNTGALFASRELPATAEVSWRRAEAPEAPLPTSGWVRVCSDRVWALQDGYELLPHVGDRALANLRSSPVGLGVDRGVDRGIDGDPTASMALVGSARCAADGGLRVQGYRFGVSEREPPLQAGPVAAREFELLLDRTGNVIDTSIKSADFDIAAFCTTAANEQFAFCEAARKVVGW